MTKDRLKLILKVLAWIATAMLQICTLLGGWGAGIINPVSWALPSMICLVFPLLWPMCVIVSLIWLFCSSDRRNAIVCGTLTLITLPCMLRVSPISFPSSLKEGEYPLTIISYNMANTKELNNLKQSYSGALSYVLHSDADIVCMQEMRSLKECMRLGNATQAQADSVYAKYPYVIEDSNEEESVYSLYPIRLVKSYSNDKEHYFNYQLYEVQVHGRYISLLNVHLSSYKLSKGERAKAYELKNEPSEALDMHSNVSLYRKLREAFIVRSEAARQLHKMIMHVKGPLIVCGDFNDVPLSYAWSQVMDTGLKDAYMQCGLGPMITFNAGYMYFHIDQMLYRPDQGIRPLSLTRGKVRSSDHYPLIAEFAIKAP